MPIPPVSDPVEVIDQVIDLLLNPRAEVAVGKGAGMMSALNAVAPAAAEAIMAKAATKTQMQDAPPAPRTSGSVQQPSSSGADIHGGR